MINLYSKARQYLQINEHYADVEVPTTYRVLEVQCTISNIAFDKIQS